MRIVWMVLLVLCGAASAAAQGGETRVVTIVNADSVSGAVVDGQRVRTLIGRVHLLQDSTDLRARRATQFLDRNEILFEGDVEIADGADTLNAREVTYNSLTKVGVAVGDVRLADDEAELFSRSATFFRAERRARFDEPVRLDEREGNAVLTSERGRYRTDTKEAFFEENVRLVDSLSVLTSERGRYGTEDKRADFYGAVRLVRPPGTFLDADSLTHFRTTELSYAYGNVRIERFGGEEDEEADTPPDSTRRTLLFGGQAFHDERARFSRVERAPLLVRLNTDSTGVTDTLLVRAVVLEASQPDSLGSRALSPGSTLQRLVAKRDVRLWGAQLAAVADSAVFDRLKHEPDTVRADARSAETLSGLLPDSLATDTAAVDPLLADSLLADSLGAGASDADSLGAAAIATERFGSGGPVTTPPVEDVTRLYRNPVVWLNARGSAVVTELSGDSIRVGARGEAVDSVRVMGRAFAARQDSTHGQIDQIRGRQLLALFRTDTLRWLKVWPNAESIYHRADDSGAIEGAVRFSADSLAFRFRGDELRDVRGVRGIQGTYYDLGLIPRPFRLEGYRYAPERRPTRSQLLGGTPLLDLSPQRPGSPEPLPAESAVPDSTGVRAEPPEVQAEDGIFVP